MGEKAQEQVQKGNFFKPIAAWFGNYPIALAVIGLSIIMSIMSSSFLSFNNIMNVLRQISMIAILAAGQFLVMVAGGIDISLGAVVGITGIVFSMGMVNLGMPPIVAGILAILVGAICGLFNGVQDAFLGIPPMIATLGTQSVARGLTYVLTNAYPISGLPESISFLGRGYLFSIPWPVLIMVVIFLIVGFVSQKTKFGRFVYASGGNSEAAYLSGIKVKKIKVLTYVIAGLLASLSSIILVSRLASGQPNAGLGWEFEAVTAVVIGGVSLAGGKGKIFGVLMGAILVGLLTNGMTLLNVNSYYQQMVKGLVLVFAVGLDVYQTRKRNKA
ncbi:MAG: ABC transporter permease [Spirochaetaceae bacterium]|nr:ABC transporter permease [Spirochaetaceae bacterium]